MSFFKNNYQIIKKAVPKEVCKFLFNVSLVKREALKFINQRNLISPYDDKFGRLGDAQIPNPNTYTLYGDATFDTLLLVLQPTIEKILKKQVVVNYSYMRVYSKGDELKKHKDRYQCGTSVTLNLGGDEWPIFIEPDPKKGKREEIGKIVKYTESDSKGVKIKLNQGDALLYNGILCEHWREPFKGNICNQVFLHYNISDEKAILNKYDGRPTLGLWEKTKIY
jgi:hypothetical protein